jgi:hypothetical protein
VCFFALHLATFHFHIRPIEPVTSSASNIQTIPLAIAQAMHARPPSPTARDATQKTHKRENPNQLSQRDARVLGFPSAMGKGQSSLDLIDAK